MKKIFFFVIAIVIICSAIGQDTYSAIKKTEGKLAKGESTINEILSDTSLMRLHSLTPFRETIKKYATDGKIKIISENEPGTKIIIKGIVVDAANKVQDNALLYFYQTSNKGWYSDTAAHIQINEGDRKHARLFGYLKTGRDGSFEIATIKPVGYPQSDLPAHIHFEVISTNSKAVITELLFDDDPRLIGEIRKRAINEGFVISKNTATNGQPVYVYIVRVR